MFIASLKHVLQATAFVGAFWATAAAGRAFHLDVGSMPLWMALATAVFVTILFRIFDRRPDRLARRKLALSNGFMSRKRALEEVRAGHS